MTLGPSTTVRWTEPDDETVVAATGDTKGSDRRFWHLCQSSRGATHTSTCPQRLARPSAGQTSRMGDAGLMTGQQFLMRSISVALAISRRSLPQEYTRTQSLSRRRPYHHRHYCRTTAATVTGISSVPLRQCCVVHACHRAPSDDAVLLRPKPSTTRRVNDTDRTLYGTAQRRR
jgi:hypothetical protein